MIQGQHQFFKVRIGGEDNALKESIEKELEYLTEKEQDIVKLVIYNQEKLTNVGSIFGVTGSSISQNLRKAIRKLMLPWRADNLRDYYDNSNEVILTYEDTRNSKRKDNTQYNEDLDTALQINAGELWNIKLGDVIENEEVFQALNEAGMWNLQELAECSEHQLRNEYGFDEEMVEYITDTLERLGVSIQKESEQELIGNITITQKSTKYLRGEIDKQQTEPSPVEEEPKTEITQKDLGQTDETIIDIEQEDISTKDTLDLRPMKTQRTKCQMLEIRLQQMQEDLASNKARLQQMQGMLGKPGMEIFKIQELATEILEIAQRIEEEQKVVDGLEIERIAEEQQLKDMKAVAISEIENI